MRRVSGRRRVPVPWIVVGMLALVWGAVVWLAASDGGEPARDALPFDVDLADTDRPATTLVSGSDWVLERPSSGADPCAQLRIGTRATTCMSLAQSGGTYALALARDPDGRTFVWLTSDVVGSIRLFTSGRRGEVHESVPVEAPDGDVGVVVVELADGEEPYGLQMLDASGDLEFVASLIGPEG